MTRKHVTAYWLIPAKPERDLFRSLIRVLAKQFDSPQFVPHLTLCVVPGRQPARKILRRIRSGTVRLGCKEIAFSSRFTKTLFVRFKSNRAAERLAGGLAGARNALSDPHLSLMYKALSGKIKRELVAAITLPIRTVRFDQLMAVDCISPAKTPADIKKWRIIATKRLR